MKLFTWKQHLAPRQDTQITKQENANVGQFPFAQKTIFLEFMPKVDLTVCRILIVTLSDCM